MDTTSGLFKANGGALPLRSVSVNADIKGYVLGLKASLKYLNSDPDPVEVLFKLPLESTQAVVGLTAIIDGKKIRAEIQEKEEAKMNYDDAIASGYTATYAEKKSDDIFSVALGNLPGGQEAEIEIQVVDELSIDAEGKVRFSLPTAFKPRYTPAGSSDPLAPVDATPGATPTEHGTIAGFKGFHLQVYNGEDIAEVSSTTHKIIVVPTNDIIGVTLDKGAELVSDLVIQITHKSPHKPMVIVEAGQTSNENPKFLNRPAVMVNFFPEIPETEVSCELIFLVDRSGSMSGGFIKSASETLVLFLKSMPEGNYFNIFGFGSRYESLFPQSVLYSEDTLSKAISHAQTLSANLGGTEILPPLRDIFKQPLKKGITRQIFLLTDGSVSNTSQCVDEVRKNSQKARCFTFGIGSGASSALVNGIAAAGNGTAEFVKVGERLQPKVIRSLKHALQPAVTDVKVHFTVPSGMKVTTAPDKVPALFDGDKTVLYGVIEAGSIKEPVKGKVELTGEQLGSKISHVQSFEIPLIPAGVDSTLPIHHLAAKTMLEDMKNNKSSKADIVKLSVEAQVISNETAFIAVNEDSSHVVTGAMKTVDILPTSTSSEIDNLQLALSSVRSAMQSNIDRAVTRGDTLDSLHDKSQDLNMSAMSFQKSAKRTKSGGGILSRLFGSTSSKSSSKNYSRDRRVKTYLAGPSDNSMENKLQVNDLMDDMMEECTYSKEIDDVMASTGCTLGDSDDDSNDEDELCARLNSLKSSSSDKDNSSLCSDPPADEDIPVLAIPKATPTAAPAPPKPSAVTPTVSLDSIILLQQANGSWVLDERFCTTIGVSMATFESSCPPECSNKIIWATIVAVAILKVKFSSKEDEWSLVVKKALTWVKKQQITQEQIKDFTDKAEKIV